MQKDTVTDELVNDICSHFGKTVEENYFSEFTDKQAQMFMHATMNFMYDNHPELYQKIKEPVQQEVDLKRVLSAYVGCQQ